MEDLGGEWTRGEKRERVEGEDSRRRNTRHASSLVKFAKAASHPFIIGVAGYKVPIFVS